MQQRTLGDTTVSAIGLGGMPMSIEGRPDEARSVATIHAALDAGVTLIDTADAYHRDPGEVGHNERLIARAVAAYPDAAVRDSVLIATKAGSLRPGDGTWYQNGDPAYIKEAAKASALRLGVEAIGLHQHHRPDPKVPYADSIGALAELLDEGVIRMAGISNANPDQIREANEVLGGRLTSVQNQFSPKFVSSYPELKLCAQMGVAFLPWSPLGGIRSAADVGTLHAPFQAVADARGVSAQQVVLAWELALAPVVIPIPGASRPSSILDSAAAGEIELSEAEMAALAVTLEG
ncbi:aldo/keto reductase [Demequina sp. NBRC 110056]|uniref:aldo/keto reductase n=1 Tax=Demequina sp. NBRC 110056 TaxID=1570345 RepID=UPI000A051FE8|nr:aldo/keto reductase [Demequina sp. NBRC 110056]